MVDQPHLRPAQPASGSHPSFNWIFAAGTFFTTLIVNGMLLAYSYGQLDHRVETLEKQRAEMREQWQEARERIEKALDQAAKEKR